MNKTIIENAVHLKTAKGREHLRKISRTGMISALGEYTPLEFVYALDYIEKLEEEILWLRCLEEAGVDSWSGVELAYELFKEYKKELE